MNSDLSANISSDLSGISLDVSHLCMDKCEGSPAVVRISHGSKRQTAYRPMVGILVAMCLFCFLFSFSFSVGKEQLQSPSKHCIKIVYRKLGEESRGGRTHFWPGLSLIDLYSPGLQL